ncbi:hypothetical protein [Chryseobacterium sp.]|uniref:hypothetical protein n=1 Tax=Chryseobacterium sp. TaxID=1871047 RepID=UPI0011CA99E0|nr:hypothetical protein [Chryseobacterium sp.]TXF79377.1 hypothetical protein FUA25_03050 [Chryseobacterium sp.]
MKTFLSIVLFLFLTPFQAQLKNIEIVDFYHWTANDGIYYEFMVAAEQRTGATTNPAVIRVKYSTDGGVSTKIASFDATLRWEHDKTDTDIMIAYIDAAETAKIIQGTGGYTPDNFILYYNISNESFVRGYQADHTELAKSSVEYAKVFPTNYSTSDDLRSLIRIFYTSSDPLYRDLMTYAAKFD